LSRWNLARVFLLHKFIAKFSNFSFHSRSNKSKRSTRHFWYRNPATNWSRQWGKRNLHWTFQAWSLLLQWLTSVLSQITDFT
jgi:hypothetical protein